MRDQSVCRNNGREEQVWVADTSFMRTHIVFRNPALSIDRPKSAVIDVSKAEPGKVLLWQYHAGNNQVGDYAHTDRC